MPSLSGIYKGVRIFGGLYLRGLKNSGLKTPNFHILPVFGGLNASLPSELFFSNVCYNYNGNSLILSPSVSQCSLLF